MYTKNAKDENYRVPGTNISDHHLVHETPSYNLIFILCIKFCIVLCLFYALNITRISETFIYIHTFFVHFTMYTIEQTYTNGSSQYTLNMVTKVSRTIFA